MNFRQKDKKSVWGDIAMHQRVQLKHPEGSTAISTIGQDCGLRRRGNQLLARLARENVLTRRRRYTSLFPAPRVVAQDGSVGIAGCRLVFTDRWEREPRIQSKSSNARGQAAGSSWDIGMLDRAIGIALPPRS